MATVQVHRWQDVMDLQQELEAWWGTVVGKQFGENFFGSLSQKDGLDRRGHPPLWEAEQRKLRAAEPIFVSSEAMDLVDHAQASFQPEPLLPQDLITPAGFAVLPRAVEVRDIRGKVCKWRAIAWSPVIGVKAEHQDEAYRIFQTGAKIPSHMLGHGVSVSLYSAHRTDVDAFSTEITDERTRAGMSLFPTLSLFHLDPGWWFGRDYMNEWQSDRMDRGEITEEQVREQLEGARFIHSFWRLMQQYVLQRTRVRPSRGFARRYHRKGFESEYVTVITLRRPKGKYLGHDGEGEGYYTHRFLVGGHWRNQYYPSEKVHRQIYIAPHWKGPEDGPVLLRKGRAFNFVR